MLLCCPHKRDVKNNDCLEFLERGGEGGPEYELSSPYYIRYLCSDLLLYMGSARLRDGMTPLSSLGHNGNG